MCTSNVVYKSILKLNFTFIEELKKIFDQLKEEYKKPKTAFEQAIRQLRKTLHDNNREIENQKAGTQLFFSIRVKIKFIIIWNHRMWQSPFNVISEILITTICIMTTLHVYYYWKLILFWKKICVKFNNSFPKEKQKLVTCTFSKNDFILKWQLLKIAKWKSS